MHCRPSLPCPALPVPCLPVPTYNNATTHLRTASHCRPCCRLAEMHRGRPATNTARLRAVTTSFAASSAVAVAIGRARGRKSPARSPELPWPCGACKQREHFRAQTIRMEDLLGPLDQTEAARGGRGGAGRHQKQAMKVPAAPSRPLPAP